MAAYIHKRYFEVLVFLCSMVREGSGAFLVPLPDIVFYVCLETILASIHLVNIKMPLCQELVNFLTIGNNLS